MEVIVCGDFNARCGNLIDYPIGDNIKNRVIDTIVNSFGGSFIGLLIDVGMCIVNGRGKPELDNFTSVSYLDHVIDFRVYLVSQLCEMLGTADFVYRQFCALVHREVEKLKVSYFIPARRRHKRAKPWWSNELSILRKSLPEVQNLLSLRISKLSNSCLEARLGWPKEVLRRGN